VLLAEFAPGLAAAPLRADLTADPPMIEMAQLPGVPLGRSPLSAAQAGALVLALDRLWNAVPGTRLAVLGETGGNASQLTREVTRMLTGQHASDDHRLVRRAWQAGADWFSSRALDHLDGGHPVLGQGDCNLANFLWDGAEVRIVDFEDSGPSDIRHRSPVREPENADL
jgi:hypothetical protein